jgi:hypothetical protein
VFVSSLKPQGAAFMSHLSCSFVARIFHIPSAVPRNEANAQRGWARSLGEEQGKKCLQHLFHLLSKACWAQKGDEHEKGIDVLLRDISYLFWCYHVLSELIRFRLLFPFIFYITTYIVYNMYRYLSIEISQKTLIIEKGDDPLAPASATSLSRSLGSSRSAGEEGWPATTTADTSSTA